MKIISIIGLALSHFFFRTHRQQTKAHLQETFGNIHINYNFFFLRSQKNALLLKKIKFYVILFLIRGPFVSLYNVGEGVRDMAKELIGILALTIVGTSYVTACLSGIIRSGGDVSFILKNDAFFIFLVVIPLSVLASNLNAPIWLIFLALKSDQLLKCIPAAIKINRFGWIKKLP